MLTVKKLKEELEKYDDNTKIAIYADQGQEYLKADWCEVVGIEDSSKYLMEEVYTFDDSEGEIVLTIGAN